MEVIGIEHVQKSPAEEVHHHWSKTDMERLWEYLAESCQTFFREVEANYLFTGCDWPEIVRRFEEEEREYTSWRDQQKLNSHPKKCNIQRSRWLASKRIVQPGYQSVRKELLLAIRKKNRDFNLCVEEKHVFWELIQYVKRSISSPIPGGPIELQRAEEYRELLRLCERDQEMLQKSLKSPMSREQEDDMVHYHKSIHRYINRHFSFDTHSGVRGYRPRKPGFDAKYMSELEPISPDQEHPSCQRLIIPLPDRRASRQEWDKYLASRVSSPDEGSPFRRKSLIPIQPAGMSEVDWWKHLAKKLHMRD